MLTASQIDTQDRRSEYDYSREVKDDAGAARISTGKPANGFLHGFTLANFLQYVEMDEKSWTLQILSNERSGLLHFREGILLDAHIDGKDGDEAALEILSWDHVDINVEGECRVEKANVNFSLKYLILEANRILDDSE